MEKHKFNEGIMYCSIGLVFLLITIPLVFPFVMMAFRVLFIMLGILMFIGGLIHIKDSFKKKSKAEN